MRRSSHEYRRKQDYGRKKHAGRQRECEYGRTRKTIGDVNGRGDRGKADQRRRFFVCRHLRRRLQEVKRAEKIPDQDRDYGIERDCRYQKKTKSGLGSLGRCSSLSS